MIELNVDTLTFSFPEVHPLARLKIGFRRTLRIPDDDQTYPLPPGLGNFPLRHVDDHSQNVPSTWLQHGGVMLPMYQSEAMWLSFIADSVMGQGQYPFAIKVATGMHCAVSGKAWCDGLRRGPQNYMVAPRQPWLDGFVVKKGMIRQFVAMPLGAGYSAEEQITGAAEYGGLQISVCPMRRSEFERRFPKRVADRRRKRALSMSCRAAGAPDMGLSPGGRMRQEIYNDPYRLKDWDTDASSRCFVHLCNSLVWESLTGGPPPHPPLTASVYTQAGLPWFDYYDDRGTAVPGSPVLAQMKSVAELSQEKGDIVLPENEPVTPDNLVTYRRGLKPGQVREGAF